MKLIRTRMATTHVDLHGERFTREALEGGAKQIAECYIPILWNHDIRLPPLGRTVSGEVVTLPDGQHALETVGEYWEEGDNLDLFPGDGRLLVLDAREYPTLGIRYDLSFRDPQGQALIRDLSSLPRVETEFAGKKAVEPIAILTIASGFFVLGKVAGGFFQRLGSDLYDALKKRLKDFFKSNPGRECIVDFEFSVGDKDSPLEVHVLIDQADAAKLEEVLIARFGELDWALPIVCEANPKASRLVFEWRDGQLAFLYGITRDCLPFKGKIVRTRGQQKNASPQ